MSSPNNAYKTHRDLTTTGVTAATGILSAAIGMHAGGGVQLTGTFTGTVQFEETLDSGTTWISKTVYPAGGGAGVTSATATGQWKFATGGATNFRVRCSAFSSGPIVVDLTLTEGVDPVIPQTLQGNTNNTPIPVENWGFSVAVVPTVTAGAYSAGDIMGALMEFDLVSKSADKPFILQEVQIALLPAVAPSFLLVIFNADPTNTTKTDNAPYSLNAADTFKVVASLPINALGGYLTDHGTPNTIRVGNLAIPMLPATGTRKIFALLVDLTGVTLTGTSDVQVRLSGTGA